MVIEWIGDVLAKGTVVAALLAGAGWLFKQQISAWLNMDLERLKAEKVQELEAKKAEYQRDLEQYRVSLIAAAERSKAEAEVKKAAALKIIEKKFNSIDALHSASLGNSADFRRVASTAVGHRKEAHFEQVAGRLDILRTCSEKAEVFLSREDWKTIVAYRSALSQYLKHCLTDQPPSPLEELDALNHAAINAELDVDWMLRRLINEMMVMGDQDSDVRNSSK